MYDVNRNDQIEPKELKKILIAMYSDFYKSDQTRLIEETVKQIYRDFDINNDGCLVSADILILYIYILKAQQT